MMVDFLDLAVVDLLHELAVTGFIFASGLTVRGHQLPEPFTPKKRWKSKRECF